ncbi:MAG: response regulator transcription factor [Caldilineaceae bacterium]|nr:response regulator transcription factor [Caldilineaceae bacterium]
MSHSREDVDPVRVLLADDHPGVRLGLRKLLEHEPGLTVVGEAQNGHEALHLTEQLTPDILLLDIEMPVMNGIEAIRRLRERNVDINILAIGSHDAKAYIQEILNCGVSGYIVKDEAADLLTQAIRQIHQGATTTWLSRQTQDRLSRYD